ncbi:phospholipase A2 inhibitor LNF1-like isoform X2 [Betta splendens]|uniref:Phospholipase A2 inhibitor LNF1-like isoform X2 n=1 Tax=Betta splendens TaxID=158456 RepID=A0A6P7MFY9_BETSP|nr:phospholipase A2 inhibitor LNF1-like isoform X2 [Betta splendens]
MKLMKMKLILFLSLAWMICNTETLRCFKGFGPGVLGPCHFAGDWCATFTITSAFEGSPAKDVERSCLPSFLCSAPNQFLSFSNAKLSLAEHLHCCKTGGCNHQDFPYPELGKPNGLKCLTCTGLGPDHVCNSTVECVGTQDRCVDVYVKHGHEVAPYAGCVSSNACDLVSQLKFRQDFAARFKYTITPRVAGSSFCSSAHITPSFTGSSFCSSAQVCHYQP